MIWILGAIFSQHFSIIIDNKNMQNYHWNYPKKSRGGLPFFHVDVERGITKYVQWVEIILWHLPHHHGKAVKSDVGAHQIQMSGNVRILYISYSKTQSWASNHIQESGTLFVANC